LLPKKYSGQLTADFLRLMYLIMPCLRFFGYGTSTQLFENIPAEMLSCLFFIAANLIAGTIDGTYIYRRIGCPKK
jgi:hypothetical protein